MGSPSGDFPIAADIAGAAQLADERARRWAPIMAVPDVREVVALLHRNPSVASAIRPVVEAAIAQLPGGGIGLDRPVFGPDGRVAWPVAGGGEGAA